MAIFDIFEGEKLHTPKNGSSDAAELSESKRDRLFSIVAARLFFVLLLVADLLWASYSLILLGLTLLFSLLTGGRMPLVKKLTHKFWMGFKRSLVCGLSLLIALFSPAFGIMIACTYFMMYDKAGLEEVVPTSIQTQFKDLFASQK
ncbi:MAG: hypothetical protein ACHQT8_02305 [Chlamydiales bacterium]